jgi:hypothetical protein
VSLRDLVALARRHLVVVMVIILAATAMAYDFKKTPPLYQESATLVLSPIAAKPNPNPYVSSYGESLINTGGLLVQWITGPQGQQVLQRAGISKSFDISLVNLSDQEYPYYGVPYATASGTATTLSEAHRVFLTGIRIFKQELFAWQSQLHVPEQGQVTTYMVGDTGPEIQAGSNKRVYAGLILLTIVTAYFLLSSLENRPVRIGRSYSRKPRRSHQKPMGRTTHLRVSDEPLA